MPEGVSPWRDHLYRDVLRLHFVRAELLRDLDRTGESFVEFEELLRIDPFDGIGATEYYFQALMEAKDYKAAQRLLDTYPQDRYTHVLWNETLVAYALGENDLAEVRRSEAMAMNPQVPEHLLARWLPQPPDYYSPGGMDEALIYAEQFQQAWKQVPGARDWLKRRAAEEDQGR